MMKADKIGHFIKGYSRVHRMAEIFIGVFVYVVLVAIVWLSIYVLGGGGR